MIEIKLILLLFLGVNSLSLRSIPNAKLSDLKSNELSHVGRVDVGKIDLMEANSLYESEEVLNKLVLATKRQQELKEMEINIKAAISSNLHKLNAISELLQLLIEKTSLEIGEITTELKETVKESEKTKNLFLVQQNYKVVPTQKLPLAEYSEAELDLFSKYSSSGEYQGLDCPLSCSPSSCDNKPKESTHCFKAETLKDGTFSSKCVPFIDMKTLTCPKGFIRCALSQPSRGNLYEIIRVPEDNKEKINEIENQEKRRSIAVSGRNMHQCLRLLVVSKKTSCNIENIFAAIDESRQLIIPNGSSIFPKIKGEIALFEDVQVKKPGKYQLCLLQFYQDPKISGGEGARIMGSDTIGELNVLDEDGKLPENMDSTIKDENSIEYNSSDENSGNINVQKSSHENESEERKDELNENNSNNEDSIKPEKKDDEDIDKKHKRQSFSSVFWYVLPIILILVASGSGFAYYYYINNKEFFDSKINSFRFFKNTNNSEKSEIIQEQPKKSD